MNVQTLLVELQGLPADAAVKIEVWDDASQMNGATEYDIDEVEFHERPYKVVITIKDE